MADADTFSAGFADAIARFNRGEFFEAHEAFEDLLESVENDERWELLLGLIQIAVGYHKATSGHPGADRMLTLGTEKLAAFPPRAHGIDLGALRRRVAEDLTHLAGGESLGSPPQITFLP